MCNKMPRKSFSTRRTITAMAAARGIKLEDELNRQERENDAKVFNREQMKRGKIRRKIKDA